MPRTASLALLAFAACSSPRVRFESAFHFDSINRADTYWQVLIDTSTPPAVTARARANQPDVTTTLTAAGQVAVDDATAFLEDHWDPDNGCDDDISFPCTQISVRDLDTGANLDVSNDGTAQLADVAHAIDEQAGTCGATLVTPPAGCP